MRNKTVVVEDNKLPDGFYRVRYLGLKYCYGCSPQEVRVMEVKRGKYNLIGTISTPTMSGRKQPLTPKQLDQFFEVMSRISTTDTYSDGWYYATSFKREGWTVVCKVEGMWTDSDPEGPAVNGDYLELVSNYEVIGEIVRPEGQGMSTLEVANQTMTMYELEDEYDRLSEEAEEDEVDYED